MLMAFGAARRVLNGLRLFRARPAHQAVMPWNEYTLLIADQPRLPDPFNRWIVRVHQGAGDRNLRLAKRIFSASSSWTKGRKA